MEMVTALEIKINLKEIMGKAANTKKNYISTYNLEMNNPYT